MPVDERAFLSYSEDEEPMTAAFHEFVHGVPTYLHDGAYPKRRVLA